MGDPSSCHTVPSVPVFSPLRRPRAFLCITVSWWDSSQKRWWRWTREPRSQLVWGTPSLILPGLEIVGKLTKLGLALLELGCEGSQACFAHLGGDPCRALTRAWPTASTQEVGVPSEPLQAPGGWRAYAAGEGPRRGGFGTEAQRGGCCETGLGRTLEGRWEGWHVGRLSRCGRTGHGGPRSAGPSLSQGRAARLLAGLQRTETIKAFS